MRLSFRGRLSVALVAVVAFAGSIAVAGDDLEACREPGQIQVRKDGWTQINPPLMDPGEGPREVVDFAATPVMRLGDTSRLYMTNGEVIKSSADGGCTWNFLISSSPVEDRQGTYKADIFSHLVAPNQSQLWAASYDTTNGVSRPHVHIFEHHDKPEADRTHGMIENGLPPIGKPLDLLVATSATGAAYLLVEEPPDARSGSLDPTHKLYATVIPSDPPQISVIGTIWQQLTPPAGFGRIEGIALGASGRSLWMWSDSKVAVTASADVAEPVWTTVPNLPKGRVASVDADTVGDALIVVETSQGPESLVVDYTAAKPRDKAAARAAASVPAVPTSMTHGRRVGLRIISSKAGTWGWDPMAARWVNITPKGVGALDHLQSATGRVERTMLGHTSEAIFRFDMYASESFLPRERGPVGTGWPTPPHGTITQPYLSPGREVVTVRPGELKDVKVEFGMPPAVNPLDVFFLVDTTSSMQPAIDSLREGMLSIAERLRKTLGRDACFGVGDFKDFGTSGALDPDKVFRTHQPIVCEDESLQRTTAALNLLRQGGGGDAPEAQTVALTQMVTGKGQNNPPVLPGQDAKFRDEAYKIVVLISDVDMHQGGGYPTIEEAASTLRNNYIKIVHVLVQNRNDLSKARVQAADLGIQTNSLAPEQGVDCDGDGKRSGPDIEGGEPLVCETNGSNPNIGPLIVSLLLGVIDPGTMAVDVDDPHGVVREPIRGVTSRIVNLKREAKLPFVLPVSCTAAQDGKDLTVGLTPTVRALPLGLYGEVVVQCRADVVPPPVPPVPQPPLEPEPVPPPPARQPVAIALAPPPNPPVQPISNINLNAGFSQQEEQQFQLAAVTQGASEESAEEEVELAMSGLDRDDALAPVGAFLAGAAMLTAAAAVAQRRRLQRSTRPAVVRAR